MTLDLRAIALQGIGYAALSVALMGFAPAEQVSTETGGGGASSVSTVAKAKPRKRHDFVIEDSNKVITSNDKNTVTVVADVKQTAQNAQNVKQTSQIAQQSAEIDTSGEVSRDSAKTSLSREKRLENGLFPTKRPETVSQDDQITTDQATSNLERAKLLLLSVMAAEDGLSVTAPKPLTQQESNELRMKMLLSAIMTIES